MNETVDPTSGLPGAPQAGGLGEAAARVPAELARLGGQAQRLTTAMERGGHMVWHRWQPTASLNGSLPPVVLLHGGSGSWSHWLRTIDPLRATGRQVLAADLPGFGDSDPPPRGGDADALVAPLAQGLAQLVPGKAVDLVGFSFGGLAAALLAAAHPAGVRQLVLVGAPAMGVPGGPVLDLRAWRHLPDAAARDAVHRHNLSTLMLHDRSLIDDDLMVLHCANLARDRMPRRRLARTDILARSLPRVNCPIAAIYGTCDALYRPCLDGLRAAFAAAAPRFGGLTLIADAGHWVQFERAEAFNLALISALEAGGAMG